MNIVEYVYSKEPFIVHLKDANGKLLCPAGTVVTPEPMLDSVQFKHYGVPIVFERGDEKTLHSVVHVPLGTILVTTDLVMAIQVKETFE